MSAASAPIPAPRRLMLHLPPEMPISDEQFAALCERNRDLRIERTAKGDLILMPPTGGQTGNRNAELTRQLGNWARIDGNGRPFDSSTGFILPNGANRSPDAAWVARARLATVPAEKRERFLPLCPDFVVELRSASDAVADLVSKMEEYIANGARLGWLIDPGERRIHVFRPDAEVRIVEAAERLSGDPELPGFELELAEIWNPIW
jgi:Uma2 family endonuclease